jgi:hypothetical protein
MSHASATPPSAGLSQLMEQGYVILPDLLPLERVASVRDEIVPHLAGVVGRELDCLLAVLILAF